MTTPVTVGDRIRAYIEARNRQLAKEAAERQAQEAAEQQAQEQAAQQVSQRDVTSVQMDYNQDGNDDTVYVDRTRLPEISPEALLNHPEAVVAVDVNSDDIDDSRNLTEISSIANELGLTLRSGSQPTTNTTYRGWTSQEIDAPPEFVQNFDYMTRLAEENPGGRWELSTHPTQGAFVRYYMPEGRMTNLGTNYKETSIIRPNQYGDKATNDVGAAPTDPNQPTLPTGDRADMAVQYADEVLSPTATAEQRTAAYEAAQELVNSYDSIDVGSGDISPDELRARLDAQLQSMGMPTFRSDGLSEEDHLALINATNNVLDGSVTPTDRRNAYMTAALAVDEGGGFSQYEEGELEGVLAGVLAAEGVPTKQGVVATAPELKPEEREGLEAVLNHAATTAGVAPAAAEPVIDALLDAGGNVDAIPPEVVTRLDPDAVTKLKEALLQASADPNLDVEAWLGRPAQGGGVTPEEKAAVQNILGGLSGTMNDIGTRIQNNGALVDGSQPMNFGDESGSPTPTDLGQAYVSAVNTLDKHLDQFANGDRLSTSAIFNTLATNKFPDGGELDDESREALMFFAANPQALRYLDGAADGGNADGTVGKKDLDATIQYVEARGDSIVNELNLQAVPEAEELTPQAFAQTMDLLSEHLDGTTGTLSVRGALANPDTSPELRAALLTLLQNPERLAQLTSNGTTSNTGQYGTTTTSNNSTYGSWNNGTTVSRGDLTIGRSRLEQVRGELTQELASDVIDRPFTQLKDDEKYLWAMNHLRTAVNDDRIGGWDETFSIHELREFLTADGITAEQRTAVNFLLDNPDFRDRLDGADDGGNVDQKISIGDLNVAIAEASRTIASRGTPGETEE